MQFKKLRLPVIVICVLVQQVTHAQSSSSPYSVLGIGDIETSSFNRYTGMANAGVALTDTRSINNSNAASLTGLSEHFYTFEIATRYKQSVFKGAGVVAPGNKSGDFAVRRINLAMKLSRRWGSSVGLQPFSTANFSYSALKNIQGTLNNVAASYEGEGGINQFYWANGYKLSKYTSLGVTSSFLFGSLKQTESLLSDGNSVAALTTEKNTFLRNYYFNVGLQTGFKINGNWQSRFGVTYSPETPLFAEYSTAVTSDDGVSLRDEITKNDYFTLPGTINLGVALIKNNQYTYTVNAQSQRWGSLNYKGTNYQLVNSSRIALGFQSSHRERNYYKQEFEKSYFQLGLYAGNAYLKVKNVQLTDFGGSIGYGLNSRTSPISVLFALEAGRRGAAATNILSEQYVNLNITFSYVDLLFKGKRYF